MIQFMHDFIMIFGTVMVEKWLTLEQTPIQTK